MSQSEIEQGIQVFLQGFSFGKSRVHPCEYVNVEDVWVMRDGPRKNARDYRKEEWIAYGVEPRKVDAVARRHTRGRYFLGIMLHTLCDEKQQRLEYKQLGYRLIASEAFFVNRLDRISARESVAEIARIENEQQAREFGKLTRTKPIPKELLSIDAPFRQYIATVEESAGGKREIVGGVRSVTTFPSQSNASLSATWCANMFVLAPNRRQGVGSALLGRMLADDRKIGASASYLLATHTGALLYPRLGYEQIGKLLIYAPAGS